MKFFALCAAALVLSAVTPVVAKDLKPATSADQWGGAFVGGHLGYGQANRNGCGDLGVIVNIANNFPVVDAPNPLTSCAAATDPTVTYDYNQSGGLIGVQGGYNWTPSEMFLIGVELDASLTGMTGDLNTAPNGNTSPFGGTANWTSMVTATAKAGVTAGKFLFYTEAGVGMANATFKGNVGCDFTMSQTGPVAGAGISFKLNDQASIDLKYDHIWLGAAQSACTSVINATFNNQQFPLVSFPTQLLTMGSADVVKVGLNFKLGG